MFSKNLNHWAYTRIMLREKSGIQNCIHKLIIIVKLYVIYMCVCVKYIIEKYVIQVHVKV